MKRQKLQSLPLGILIFLLALGTAPPAQALNPDLDFTAGCPQGLPAITNGCLIAGTYQDGNNNDFQIQDASTSNKARVEFIEGSVNKLILTGVTVRALEQITNAKITFKRKFTGTAAFMASFTSSVSGQNRLSGGYSLLFPNQSARTVSGKAQAELCMVSGPSDPSPGCLTANGTAFSQAPGGVPLVGSIASGQTFASFSPSPDQEDYGTEPTDTKPLLYGEITISSLRNTERVTNLNHSIFMALTANLPPFDSGSCSVAGDVGNIIRGTALDGSQDTICIMRDDGTVTKVTGDEAINLLTAPQCAVSPGEAHRPANAGP